VCGRSALTFDAGSSVSPEPVIATNFRFNHQIRISPVRLINASDEMVGIVPTSEALRMANEAGLDLVEVAPTARPPVCKILDYGKFKYQQSKKEDKARSHSKAGQLKEVKIKTVRIGDHDLMIKINHAREFLAEGNKVQFTLQFKGREIAHSQLGYDIFRKIKEELFLVSKVEQDAKLMGKRINMVLMPDHKDPSKLKPAEAKPAGPMRSATSGSTLNIPLPKPADPVAAPVAAPKPAATVR
jgi:translation initiation factor IF-3